MKKMKRRLVNKSNVAQSQVNRRRDNVVVNWQVEANKGIYSKVFTKTKKED